MIDRILRNIRAAEIINTQGYTLYVFICKNHGKYFFIRFPWESVFTGEEATPKAAYAKNQYGEHITADVGNAVRAIFFATYDLNWMKDYGCDLAIETARFWAGRVAFNKSANRFDINEVIGPDEDRLTVNNNPFTNAAAALNLYFGTSVSSFNFILLSLLIVNRKFQFTLFY